MTQECGCGRPLKGDAICEQCSRTLEDAISNISAHWVDLDVVRAKLTRYGDPDSGQRTKRNAPPLLIDARFGPPYWAADRDPLAGPAHEICPHASCAELRRARTQRPRVPDGTALIDAVKQTVAAWTNDVLAQHPPIYGPVHEICLCISCASIRRSQPPRDNVPSCCAYLRRHLRWIRARHWVPQMLDELTHIETALRRMIDRPAGRWYAGPCDHCERDLYARVGHPVVTCRDCELDYDVDARRTWLLEQAQSHLATAVELARAVSWLGTEPLTAERVRKWAERGRITAKGHTSYRGRQVPVYLVRDAIDLLAQDIADESRKRTKQ